MRDTASAGNSKTVKLGDKTYELRGSRADDPYLNAIGEGFEADFVRFCDAHLRAGDRCLDVGANIGVTALIMADHVPQGRVVAVEASPQVFAALRDNAACKPNITPIHAAAGDRDGAVTFEENSAWGHVSTHGVEVPMRRLETIVADAGLDRVDFIKIDVEGYESCVLRDALPLIQRSRALVYFEINSFAAIAHAGVSLREFADWLLSVFPTLHVVRRGGTPHLRRITDAVDLIHTNLVEDRIVSDFVATCDPGRIA